MESFYLLILCSVCLAREWWTSARQETTPSSRCLQLLISCTALRLLTQPPCRAESVAYFPQQEGQRGGQGGEGRGLPCMPFRQRCGEIMLGHARHDDVAATSVLSLLPSSEVSAPKAISAGEGVDLGCREADCDGPLSGGLWGLAGACALPRRDGPTSTTWTTCSPDM